MHCGVQAWLNLADTDFVGSAYASSLPLATGAAQAAAGGAHIESLLAAAASCGADSATDSATDSAAAEPAASSAEAPGPAEPPGPRPSSARPPAAPPSQQGEWSGLPIGWLRTCYVEKNGTLRQP